MQDKMTMFDRFHSRRRGVAGAGYGLAAALLLALGACGALPNFSETYQRGYVLPEGALEQIPVGASQEQVLIVLGTPSTVATVSGEVFYYISQKTERRAAFMPNDVKTQRVIAVYFDKDRRVQRLANYGIKDGKIFDFISRRLRSISLQNRSKSCWPSSRSFSSPSR
jgi:outer membrane protein assembly factor BamE (lipoprotein component of BamABCDE complex)